MLFHGYSAEKSSLIEEAKTFLTLGASVLLVDFRGSGESSESYTTVGVQEADDVAAVARYAEDHFRHSRIIFFGQSMGAAAILRAVSHDGISPDAVILEAVFDTMFNTVRNRFSSMHVPSFPSAQLLVLWGGWQWRFDGFRHNPVDYATALQCPALFMHGSDDPRATLAEGRRVFDAVSSDKMFRTFQNTGHHSYVEVHRVAWTDAVENLMKKTENQQIHGTTCRRP
jgi:pimeloyl-ACP methyl ester carboxylesterase